MGNGGVMVLSIILPDKRVLIHRISPTGGTPEAWGITQEVYLLGGATINTPTQEATSLLSKYYGVHPARKEYGSLMRESAIRLGNTLTLYPYVFHVKGRLRFSTAVDEEHKAIPWEELYDDITAQAINNELDGGHPVYTTISMHAVAELHTTGHFDI